MMVAAVLDATFMKVLQFWGGAPNLTLMIIVSWAMLTDLEEALPWAVMGGIMRDLLSVAPTGSSALAFVLIVVIIDTTLPKLSWRNIFFPPISVFIATYIYDNILYVLLTLAGYTRPFYFGQLYVSLPGAVGNTLLILFVYRTIGSINAFLRPQRASLLD
jgi:rod shape-determining protein MreD